MSFKWGTHRAVAGACAFALSLAASANPENGQIVGGSGSISQAGALTQINQASAALAINWDSFDVGAAEVVQFIQPDVSSVALNRITGGGASEIFGSIDANGSVFLVNTAGVVFAPGSQINVGNLVVSGLDMTVEDFMAGNYALAANGLPGAVINHGTIAAASGGSVVLVGGQVVNTGLIRANYGRVTLAGAEAGYLDFDGDGLLRFEVTGELKQKLDGADAAVTNSGVIEAQGGEVIMQASAARGIFDTLVNNEGIIEAGAISIEGGVIRLVADGGDVVNTGAIVASSQQAAGGRVTLEAVDGDVINEGEIEATSVAASGGFIELVSNADTIIDGGMVDAGSIDAVGGTIHALGNRVIVQGPSRLGSAGGAGGGVILIGGSYQGSNPLVRNASQTFVGADVEIDAGAVNSGDGGTVIVWSDDYTWFFGTVSARGPPSGHGGFVEVSSHGTLAFSGLVDTRAGTNGTLLLDPTNIRICTACTTTVNNSAGTFSDANSDGDGGDSRLLVTDLTGQLNATNVIVTTASGFSDAGNITVETAISWSSNNSLTLTANNNITTNAGASITTTGTGNLTLSGGTATGVITINAVISLNGGDFSATASQITTTGTATIAVGAGDITLTAEEIDLGLDVSGAGTLILQPFNPATSIGIAGGAGTLDLSMADLGHVLNGFSSILIGRSDGSGGITVSAVTFTDPVTLRSPSGGTIAVNGTLAGTGNASITLDGSGATTILNAGITTDGTDITISDNVELADGATVTLSTGATTSGNISITGTTNGNAGAGAESLTVVSGSGTITFTGAVGGGTPLALTLQSDNAGNIGTVTFTAAANATSLTTFAHGYAVVLNGGGTFTALVDFLNTGAVTLGNDTGDTFAFNGGLDTSNGPSITNLAGSISTSNDAITLGPATLTQDTTLNAGTAALTLDSVMGSAFGLTLIGDEIDLLGGDDSVTGSGAISLAPATAAESIGVGDAAAGTLNLSDADLDAIDEGHTSITIGSAAGSHDITIDTAFSFSDPVSFLAQAAGGSITLAGNLGGTDNASITFNSADGTTLGANITTADDDITINDDVVIAEAGVVVLDTGTGGGGNISIAGSVDGTAGNADESLQLISGSGTIGITGAVGGTDPIDLVLQSDDSGNAGAVTFNAAVGALSLTTFAHGYSVALLAGGTITDPVSFLNTAGVTLGDDVGDLTTFDGGVTSTASTTTIAGAVATSDDSLTLGAVVLATDVTLTSGAGAIITGSVTDGASAFDLTLQDNTGASTGGVTLGGSVTIDDLVTFGQAYAVSLHGAANTFDSQVTFLNTGTTTLGNEATDSSTFDAGVTATAGAVSLAGTVATTNDSVDLGAVTLTADSTLRSGSATITVASVTGAFDLTLQDNTAGSTGGVTFTGNVTIDDLVTFGQAYAVSLHGAANTFTSQVTFLNTGTTTLGNEATDSSTFDGGLTANAGAVNVAGSVLTSDDAITLGAFTLTTALTLDTNATTTAGDLSIGAVTGGGFDLTLETGGVAGADLTGTSVTNAATLTLQDIGGTASFSGSVSVTALTVAGSVAGVSLTGGATVTNAVTFANTGTLILGDNSGDAFTFTGGVTATAPSSISLGGGFSTTNAGIAFGDADTASALNSDSTFTAGTATVAFDDLNTSASSLTITADGIDFGGGSNSVTGGGAVVLQGGSATTTVGVGGGGGTLQIDTTDLDALADGHSAITIGRSDGTGLVTVGTYAFKDPVTIRAGAPTGDITVSGALSSTDANITLNAGRDFLLSGSVAAGAPGTGNSRTGGSVTITAGGAVTLNGAVSTAAINLNDITNTNHALTGSISVTAGGAISGNASGTLTTGAATTDGTGAAGGETATSGSITVTATGALQLLATDALRTGNATTASNGNDNTTAGSITVSAAAVSSNGTAQLDVSFGTASGGTANTSGTLTATTTGGGGNAGGILITSGEALRVGVLTTAGGSSQNITITGVGITLTDVVHTVTNDVISLDATTGTLSIANGTNDLNVGTGNLSLRGDEINLSGGAGSVIGTGTVTLSAGQVGTAVEVAGAGGTGSLDLTATDIAALANGFSGITIGRMDSTAALTIIGAITFNDNVTLIGGSITSSATLTGSAGVAVTLRSVNGSIIDGDDADTANVTAGTITLIAANGGGIGAIGQSGDRFDVTGVTVLTLEAEGSIRVRGDNATNLTDLIITVDPSQQADSTYQIDNFDGMTFGSTGLVDSGADLFIEGIRVNDNENVAMNITITAVTGDIYLSDSEGDNSSPANLPAIDFSPEGGDITIIATAGDILDQFENDADTTGATFANLIVKTDATDVVTLTASGTVGTGVAASDTDGSGAGSGGDIDIRGTGAFNCSGTTTNCTSNIVGDTYDESIDPAGDVDSFDRVVGAFTINFEPCFTGDVCLLIAENGGDNDPNIVDGSAFTLSITLTSGNLWIYDHATTVDYVDGGAIMGPGGIFDLGTGTITLTAQTGGVFEIANGTATEITAGGTVTINAAIGIGTMEIIAATPTLGLSPLDISGTTLAAHVTMAGNLLINEASALTLTDVDTANGFITITAGGLLTASDVVSTTDADANDITLTGDGVALGTVNAGATAGDVVVDGGSGAISSATSGVTGQTITLTAGTSIGSGTPITVSTTNLTLTAGTTFAVTTASDLADLTISADTDLNGSTLTAGGLTFSIASTGTDITLTNVTDSALNFTFNALSGNLIVNAIDVGAGALTLTADTLAGQQILDDEGALGSTTRIAGGLLTLTARSGIGTGATDVDTDADSLVISVTDAGVVNIDEADAVTLTSVTTADGAITVLAGGALTVTSVVSTTDADANDISLTGIGIVLDTVNAGGVDGDVTLDATTGGITDTNGASTLNVTGDDVSASGDMAIELDTSADTLTTDTSGGGANQTLREADGLSDVSLNAGAGTITLTAGGVVGQPAGSIVASGLELLGAAASYALDSATNNVATLAANTGALTYVDAGDLAVGTVNTVGVMSTGAVSLTAGGVNGVLTLTNDITATADQPVTLTADNMTLTAAVGAGAGTVTLQPFTGGTLIDLGDVDASGTLGLTDLELDQITANALIIGSPTAGNLSVTAAIDLTTAPIIPTLTLLSGGNVMDGGGSLAVTNLVITADGIGASGAGNQLEVSVDSLTTDTATAGGSQFLSEANGLTDLNLDAGAGNVELTLTLGGIADTAADAEDIVATNASVTLLGAGDVGATGAAGNIETSVDSLTVSTAAGGGSQFLTEASGLTDLNLDAGAGNVELTLTLGGIVDTAVDSEDITAGNATVILSEVAVLDVGASGNPIETSVGGLTVDTSAGNGSQYLVETNGLTDLNLDAGTGGVELTLTLGGIADTAVDAEDITALNATVTLSDVTAQDVGTSANPLETSVDTLTVATSAGNGDQFLTETSGLTDLSLNAGTGAASLTLTAGSLVDTDGVTTDVTAADITLRALAGSLGASGNPVEVAGLTRLTVHANNSIFVAGVSSPILTDLTITLNTNSGGTDTYSFAGFGSSLTLGLFDNVVDGISLGIATSPGGTTNSTTTLNLSITNLSGNIYLQDNGCCAAIDLGTAGGDITVTATTGNIVDFAQSIDGIEDSPATQFNLRTLSAYTITLNAPLGSVGAAGEDADIDISGTGNVTTNAPAAFVSSDVAYQTLSFTVDPDGTDVNINFLGTTTVIINESCTMTQDACVAIVDNSGFDLDFTLIATNSDIYLADNAIRNIDDNEIAVDPDMDAGSVTLVAQAGGIFRTNSASTVANITTRGAISLTGATGVTQTGSIGTATAPIVVASSTGTSLLSLGRTADGLINVYTGGALQLNGFTSMAGGSTTVGAAGDLLVNTNISQTGVLVLAADVTAGGLGQDGVGTLTIGAGRTVTSSSATADALTLRGVDLVVGAGADISASGVGGGIRLFTSNGFELIEIGHTCNFGEYCVSDAEFATLTDYDVLTVGESGVQEFVALVTVAPAVGPADIIVNANFDIYLDDGGVSAAIDGDGDITLNAGNSIRTVDLVPVTFRNTNNVADLAAAGTITLNAGAFVGVSTGRIEFAPGQANVVITSAPSGAFLAGLGDLGLVSVATGGGQLDVSLASGFTLAVASTISTGAAAITLTADEIDFNGGPGTVASTGTLVLRPVGTGVAIDIGSTSDVASSLSITDDDIAALVDGFLGIEIGRTDGTHTITVYDATFTDGLVLRAPLGTGGIVDDTDDALTDLVAPVLDFSVGTGGVGLGAGGSLDVDLGLLTGSSGGDVAINEANSVNIALISAAGQTVTLSAGAAITDANGNGTNNIVANLLDVTADTGINLDTNVAFLTAANGTSGDIAIREANGLALNTVSAPGQTVTLNGGTGAIADNNAGAVNVTANLLDVTAAAGIDLDTDVVALTASNTSSGGIDISDADDLGLNAVSAATQAVTLASAAGAITDNNGAATNVTGSSVVFSAATGIGSGDPIEIAVSNVAASNTTSGNIELVQPAGNLTAGVSGAGVSNAGGDIVLTVVTNTLEIAEDISSVGNRTTITVGDQITAFGGGVVTADELVLSAVNGISSGCNSCLNLVVGSLQATNSGIAFSSGIELNNTGDIVLADITGLGYAISNPNGGFDFENTGSITIDAEINTGRKFDLTAFGALADITVNADITSGSTAPASFTNVLNAANDVIQTAGTTITSGDVQLFITAGNEASLAAVIANGTVTLVAGSITDNNVGATNVTANLLEATASTGIDLDTAIGFLTAGNSTSGGVNIADTDGFAVNTVGAAGQTVTLNGGTGAITDNNLGAVNVTADLLDVTAATGIDLDTDIVELTASNPTSGGINIADTNALAVNTVSAPTQTVTLNGGLGAITDNNLGATNVTASLLDATGAGVDLDTAIAFLSVGSTGAVNVSDTDGFLVNAIGAAGQTVTLNGGTGAVGDNNAGLTNVAADALDVTAATGIDLDTAIATLTASNTGSNGINITEANGLSVVTVSAPGQTVTLNGGTGGIADGNGLGVNVTADTLSVNSGLGIDLDTDVNSLNGSTGAAGSVSFDELDGVTVTSFTTANGGFTLTSSGNTTLTSVVSSTSNDANDITVTAATGDLSIGTVNAGTTGADVTLEATTGSILNSTSAVTGDVVTLTAQSGVGASGARITTTAATVNATTTAAGAIWLNETNGASFSVTAADGLIDIVTGGNSTLVSIISSTDADANDITILATAGNILVDLVDTDGADDGADGDVTITAMAGSINDAAPNPNFNLDVRGDVLTLDGATGMGNIDALELDGNTLNIDGGTGGIGINDLNGGDVTLALASAGNISYGTDGNIFVDSVVSTGGTVTLISFGGAINDHDDDLLTDISGTTVTLQAFLEVGGNVAAGSGTDAFEALEIVSTTLNVTAGVDASDLSEFAGTAGIVVSDSGGTTLGSLSTVNGDITVMSDGTVAVGAVFAGTTTLSNVVLDAVSFSDAGAGDITADLLTVDAAGPIVLSTDVNTLDAATTAAGAITITEANDIALASVVAFDGAVGVTAGGSIDVDAVSAAGQTVTLDAGGAITDANAGAVNVTSSLLMAMAGTGIALDTDVAFLTASNTTSGDIGIADVDGFAANTISAIGQNVTLDGGTGAIGDNNGGAVNVTADLLDVTAVGVDLDTAIDVLIASSTGAVDISDADDLALETVDAAGQSVTLAAVAGAILDNNGDGVTNVTADSLVVSATSGIEVDTAIATLTASNATAGDVDVADTDGFAIVTVSAPGQTVTLDGGTGAIDDDVTDAVTDITAMTISLTAASGIGATADLETSAEAVTALSTAGDIDLNNSLAADPINGVAVDLETTSGNISFDQTGGESVLVNNAVTNTAGDISITATDPDDGIAAIFMDAAGSASVTTVNTGFILVRDITAANTVTLTSADAIDEDYQLPTAGTSVDPDVDITAASIVMSAVTGIGAVEALEISASTISADTTDGNVFVSSVATGPVTVTSLSTGTGTILFGQTGGQTLTINSAITDGFIGIGNDGADLEAVLVFSNNADLFLQTTTSGDIDVGQVGALAISLDSAGAITDTNGAATNVGGALLDATAATGIDLDASIFVLSASNTTSGGVNISDNNGFLVDTVTASGQTVTLNGGAGSIGDNNGAGLTNVTANLLDVTAATGIALETDIVELTASNTTSGGITIVDANGFAANAITAAGQAVTLDGGVGAITDNNGAATNVTADVLVVGAETGIDLDTAIAELTASNDLSGDVDIADVDGFVVNTVSAASQTVTLDGGSGAIGDNNAGAVNVTASLLDATATTGISLDTDITSLTASNATSGGIDVADTSGIAVNDVTAAGQTVTLNAGTGALTDNNGAGVTNVTAGTLDATATSGINLDTAIGVLIASNSSSGGISIAEVDGFAADAITAAGQLVTLDGGTGAITDNNGATTNVTGGLLTVTASTGIDLDTAIAFLTATNTTSGGINVSDTDGFGVNTVTAGGQTVTLNGGTGALSDANGPATNVTAGLLDATATTGINLDTAIDFLTATNATVGGITIGDTDGFAVNAVTAAGQLVTLDAGTGALADGNGAATNVTALGLVASAATGIDLDTAVDVVNAGNTTSGGIDISDTDGFGLGVASAPLQAVALNGGTGAITDDNGAGTNVTADTLSITASTGIDVDTAINFLTASNTTSGGINIEDTNGFALNTVTAAGQTVTLDGGTGAITDNNAAATNVSANLFVGIATTGIDLDTAISQLTALNTTSGDIDIADTDGFVVNAIGAPGQTVTLNGGTGGIGDNNGTATNVTAGTLDATATTGISLDTSIAFLTASNTGVGGIDITDTDSVAVNTVTAAGQLVVLNAGTGALTDNNGAAVNVTADQFTATAPTGINLDIDANTLTFTSGGAVNLSEVDDIVLAGASTADSLLLTAGATISDGTDGDLNVTGNAAFDGTAITLGNDAGNNTNFGTLTFTSPGAVSIAEDSATQFAGSSAADSLALTSTGAITQTAGSSVSVITLTTLTTPTAGSNVILDQGNDFGTVSLVGANSVTINDTDGDASAVNDGLVLGATNVNSLTATTVGALSDNGTVGVAVAAVFSGSSITLGSAGETTSFGRLTFTSPGAVSIETDTGITLVGASQAGSLSLSANGAIGEFDGTTTLGVTGLTTLTATNNNVALDNGHVLGTVSVTDAVNVVLVTSASDPDGIVLGDITTVSGGDLSVTTAAGNIDGSGGALQISGDSTFTVNNAVITVDNAGNDFTNTVSFFGATDVSVLDTTALDLAGADLTGNLTVVAAGITATDAVVVGGLASFDAGAGNDLELLDGGNDFETLEVVSAANVSVFDLDDITLGDITASGALMLDADSVASTGDVMVAGTTTINSSVGDVLLGGANDFVGAVDIASAGDIGINDVNDLSLNLLSGNAIVITAGGGVLDAAADLGTPLARGEDDILAGGALSITASSIGSSTDALEISAPNDGVATLDAGGIVVDFSNDVHFAGGLSIANASTAEITAQTITVDGDFGESITDLHLIARDVIIGGDGTITALRLQLDALNLVSNDDGDNVIGSIAAPVFLNLANGSDYVVPEPTLYPGNNNELNGFGFISASNFTGTDFNDIFNDSNNRVFLIANFTDLIASVQGSFITAQIFTIDSSQFRADLNIFGVDGAGILLPLDQCEDEESADCAKQ